MTNNSKSDSTHALPRQLLQSVSTAVAASIIMAGVMTATPAEEMTFTGCGGQAAPYVSIDYEERVIELINQARAQNGDLPPLKRIDELTESARYHATDMSGDDYFDHDTYDRSTQSLDYVCGAFDRISLWYTDWRSAAENIAAGYTTPESVVAGWLDRTGHRHNILNPNFSEVGAGYYRGSGQYGEYWVVNFGVRRNVYPIIIDGEARIAQDRNVDLYVYGDWSEIRLRNDYDPWGEWRPFSNRLTWTLPEGGGEHTVYAEVRLGAATAQMNDTIWLDGPAATPPTATPVATPPATTGTSSVFLPLVAGD